MTPKDLRSRRLAKGLSRTQLAAKVGVSPEVISRWEMGDEPITHQATLRVLLDDDSQGGDAARRRRS